MNSLVATPQLLGWRKPLKIRNLPIAPSRRAMGRLVRQGNLGALVSWELKFHLKRARHVSGVLLGLSILSPGVALAHFVATSSGVGTARLGTDFSLTRAVDQLTTAAILGTVVSYSTLAPAITQTSSVMDGISGVNAIENPSGSQSSSAATLLGELLSSYHKMMALPNNALISGDINGLTLVPGVYFDAGALNMAASGVLTLDGRGDPNALFVFQVTGSIGIGAGSLIKLINGAQGNNVYWVSTGAFGGGAGSSLAGNVIANGAGNPGAGSTFVGRILSLAALTLTSVTITTPVPS